MASSRGAGAHAVVVDLQEAGTHADPATGGTGVPYDVGDALPQRPAEQFTVFGGDGVGRAGKFGFDARGCECRAGTGQFAENADATVPAHGGPDILQSTARQVLQVRDLRCGPAGVNGQQPAGQLRLDSNDREGVAKDVVHVPRHPVAFLPHRQLGEFVLGLAQFADGFVLP